LQLTAWSYSRTTRAFFHYVQTLPLPLLVITPPIPVLVVVVVTQRFWHSMLSHHFVISRPRVFLLLGLYDITVASRNPKTVVVNLSGSPVTVSPFINQVPSFLQAWFVGQECGPAIARVLLGNISPSGRLPMSWPRKNGVKPAYHNFLFNDNLLLNYEERLKVGYCFYDDETAPTPQFHFGAGLSYATFTLGRVASLASRHALRLWTRQR
jgi:hypothetical protein